MYKTILRILALCSLLLPFQGNCASRTLNSNDEHDITIVPSTNDPFGAPRAPAYNPFFAYEDGTCNGYFNFNVYNTANALSYDGQSGFSNNYSSGIKMIANIRK